MRALLSVWDKTGLVEFARGLVGLGWELVSTGNTEHALTEAGIAVTGIAAVTGFPEILGGRVKTLHPAVHGGILARRDNADDITTLAQHNITAIDMVVSNLYPFAATVADPSVAMAEALEKIDIGGPTLVRAAAKNYPSVLVVTEAGDYDRILALLRAGGVPPEERRALAAKAFAHVAAYDTTIATYLRGNDGTPRAPFPAEYGVAGALHQPMRYGENPHQAAALYRAYEAGRPARGLLGATQLAGKELSYNNILDADAAWTAACDFLGWEQPACVIVKHNIPCGIALGDDPETAFRRAYASDPLSAFGGVIALTTPATAAVAEAIAELFVEVVLAPSFDDEARAAFARRKNVRLLAIGTPTAAPDGWEVRSVQGGFLLQTLDEVIDDPQTWKVVSQRPPTGDEVRDLRFAWRAARHVKSNSIVLVTDGATVGIGGGQPSRIDAAKIALAKAGDRARGSVMASDAYFPFADTVEVCMAMGVRAIVHPGGSIRDAESIAAADAGNAAMLVTGRRHFRH
ncbi:MAG: bifunctional phosphoribosylaminoimidazolecarboxamide formyltransferase/IMP cyclohydrolase [Thermomicrobia bacterium]|nr:bifunctional phosphoribosylaminoimidazolecarboxamide formyltransferase/IMP cyclohydrolase [Thermomicrobia bacterium]